LQGGRGLEIKYNFKLNFLNPLCPIGHLPLEYKRERETRKWPSILEGEELKRNGKIFSHS